MIFWPIFLLNEIGHKMYKHKYETCASIALCLNQTMMHDNAKGSDQYIYELLCNLAKNVKQRFTDIQFQCIYLQLPNVKICGLLDLHVFYYFVSNFLFDKY